MIDFVVLHDGLEPEVTSYAQWLYVVAAQHTCVIREITYILTTDEEILRLNQTYLKHDYYTDVLAFDRSTDKEMIGDIYISLDRVEENAREYGVAFDEELRRVIVHGLLHMMGYSDKDEEGEKEMRKAENSALELFHVKQ